MSPFLATTCVSEYVTGDTQTLDEDSRELKWLFLWKSLNGKWRLVTGYAGREEQVYDYPVDAIPIQSSWDRWCQEIKIAKDTSVFEYSPWALRYERNIEKLTGYGYLVGSIVHGYLFFKFIGLLPAKTTINAFLIIMVAMLFLGLGLMSVVVAAKRFKGAKKLITISIDSKNIVGGYNDHTIRKNELKNIKNIYLKGACKIRLKFRNGEVWKYMDRFSYWPILRKRLIEK